jgi:hypothetical protein
MERIHHSELVEGQRFSVDGGLSWHVTAVPLFGNVAAYVDQRRGDDAWTQRIDADDEGMVTVEG